MHVCAIHASMLILIVRIFKPLPHNVTSAERRVARPEVNALQRELSLLIDSEIQTERAANARNFVRLGPTSERKFYTLSTVPKVTKLL